MRRTTALLASAAAASALLAPPAAAEHCSSRATIFSRTRLAEVEERDVAVQHYNAYAAACAYSQDELGVETRRLGPLANQVSVRYSYDFGSGVPELRGRLDGLGFAAAEITLVRRNLLGTGVHVYDSTFLDLPAGAAAQGRLTATVLLPYDDGSGSPASESVTFVTALHP